MLGTLPTKRMELICIKKGEHTMRTPDQIDNLAEAVVNLYLIPNVDIDIHSRGETKDDDLDIYIFWHNPSINVGWYPIAQIDHGGKTIFHREGSEAPDNWYRLLDAITGKLYTAF